MIELYNGDCLEIMKNIPDKSIDLILTDPPYGSTRCDFDKIIDIDCMWEQLNRIIVDNGAIVLFANQPFTSMLINSNLTMFKYVWIWQKPHPTGFLNANYRPLLSYEEIIVFSKASAGSGNRNNSMKYYPQGLIEINRKKKNKANSRGKYIHETSNVGENNQLNSDKEYVQKYTGYPTNILVFDRDKDTFHPTQKPVSLMEYLIKTYTNEQEHVLDFCMGSGTTGVACKNLNRNFIGIEIDNKYFNCAKERIEKHQTANIISKNKPRFFE